MSSSCEKPSITRYVHDKCRCDECRKINSAAQLRRDRARMQGKPTTVDGDLVRAKIEHLKAQGMSNGEICRACQISNGTLTNIYYRHWRTGKPVTRVKRETAERILAVAKRSLSRGQQVSREPMDRRIVEMLADGYSIAAQSRLSGIDRQVLDKYKGKQHKTVSAASLVRFMLTTDHALKDWCREPKRNQPRAINASVAARKTVERKWRG